MAPPLEGDDSLQDDLLERVRKLTQGHGTRKALAEYLGIHPARLSAYLAIPPTKRPNGEMTLQILAWVDAQEKR